MKKRVYHLAENAGITAEEALSKLQAAGYKVKTINDQISRYAMTGALAILTRASITQPSVGKVPTKAASSGISERIRQADPSKTFHRVSSKVIQSDLLQPPKKRRDRQHTARYLDTSYIVEIHNALVTMFAQEDDPISPPGPKDMGLLESAAHRPQTSLGDVEKYQTIHAKAAALFHSMVKNHPFHNGNKRTALVAMLVFLEINGLLLNTSDDDLFDFVISTAKSDSASGHNADAEVQLIEAWLREHSSRISDQIVGMKTKEFLDAVESAGGRYRESADGNRWVIWGPNNRCLNINKIVTELTGSVVRTYLKNLGLSHGQSGIHFDEFEDGLDVNQRMIRRFRVVLKNLAHA